MANNTDCKQVVNAPIETIVESFRSNLRHITDKLVSCFYHCFQLVFINWAQTTYDYYPEDFIHFTAETAFTDSMVMFTEKAANGSIYNGNAGMRTIVFSFYRYKMMEAIQAENRLLAKKKKHESDDNAGPVLLNPAEAQTIEDMYHSVEKAMAKMEPIDRRIITWRHLEGKPNDEIARLLSITTDAATNRIFRCMQRLRNLINQENRYE